MGNKWSHKDLGRVASRGMTVHVPPIPKNRQVIPKREGKEIGWMHWNLKVICDERKLTLEKEHIFHPTRKWRFDFAILEEKIAVEFEGIFKGTSRHTTVGGFLEDTNKYNAAATLGWKVFRYTANNYPQMIGDLKQVLCGIKK